MMTEDDPMSTNGQRPPIDPELISAFYDAETTEDERAAVEQCMDDAYNTLHTLEEYDQLSRSLKDLHRQTQSPDLHKSVMQQIGAQPVAAAAVTSKWRRTRVYSIAAGLAGLAAAVMLLWPGSQAPPAGEGLAMTDATPVRTAFTSADASLPTAESTMGRNTGVPAPAVTTPAARSATAESAAMEATVAQSLDEMARERPVPEIGDIVAYMDRNADELTWVAVTVVDVQTAGNQVQLLLARHGVESPAGNTSLPDADNQQHEPLTILVEADWEQMAAVIGDLRDEAFVNAMVVDAPASEPAGGQLAARSAVDPQAAEGQNQTGNAVQLPASVPDTELKRIASRRGDASGLRAQIVGDAPNPADVAPPASPPAPEIPTIAAPLARPRVKAVFVIQKLDQ